MQVLVKMQITQQFSLRKICGDLSPKVLRFVWSAMLGTNTVVGQKHLSVCYKSVNLSLEELKNIKIILFLINISNVQIAEFT